ncbi:MAG: alpha-amylase family glycosyl hydrolase, partial [Thermoanaerobaculia bacterium]|nr:alpha-amylase family glycosyl hydrolase [Thermoanaerobaculia bacterium]
MSDSADHSGSTSIATYRVQLNRELRFRDLRPKIDYLRRLGISTVYTSPILAARSESTHGYDVVDPTRLNPELGSEEDFDELLETLDAAGLGLLIDIVPNHMAANSQNPWWRDVLRQGQDSPYASYFDVDWSAEPIRENLSDKVLLPILGRPYGDVLEDQEIQIRFHEGAFFVQYYER